MQHQPSYSLEHGSYYLKTESGQIRFMTDEVAIAFSAQELILLKHGRPEDVARWLSWAANQNTIFGRLIILQGKLPIDVLNRILDTTGYLKHWLASHQLDQLIAADLNISSIRFDPTTPAS